MRTITHNELPQDLHRHTLIKFNERCRYRRMANALERTLNRCSEIYAEYESHTDTLRESCKKEGFTAGFTLFFSQILQTLNEFEECQNKRMDALRANLRSALESSLQDPVIVERIIHHLQEKSGQQKALKIIIPKGVQLPHDLDISNYQFCDHNHITIQNDMDSIRFPSESLCQQWLANAEQEITSLDKYIDSLIPNLLYSISKKLLTLSKNASLIIDTEVQH